MGPVLDFLQKIDPSVEVVSTNMLYSDLSSAYYRLEVFAPQQKKIQLDTLIEERFPDSKFHLREDLSLYKKPLIDIQPQKSIEFRKAFMATSPAALESAIQNLLPRKEDLCKYTGHRMGLISDGTALELPHQVTMQLERDAFLVARHAGVQAIPIWFNSKNEEEFLKTVVSIAQNYFLIRLSNLKREFAIDITDRIEEIIDIPLIHAEFLETATVIAAILKNAARIHSMEIRGKTIGIVGLGPAGHGLKDLMVMMGAARIFGIDADSRQLTRFEKRDGTATSLDHIYDNADFIIITPGTITLLNERRFHPGQIVLCFQPDLIELDRLDPEVRARTYQGYEPHPVFILPGIVSAAQKYRIRKITMDMRLKLLETLLEKSGDNRLLPVPSADLFRAQTEALEVFAVSDSRNTSAV